jgi:hypothetical protein
MHVAHVLQSLYYTHPQCPHRRNIFTMRQEATGAISELITVLGSGVISPLAAEPLVGHFSSGGLAAVKRKIVLGERLGL